MREESDRGQESEGERKRAGEQKRAKEGRRVRESKGVEENTREWSSKQKMRVGESVTKRREYKRPGEQELESDFFLFY